MASKTAKPKNYQYGVIQRGASLTIPVTIKDVTDKPLDLTDSEVAFTVKPVKSDFDREDMRAYIQKNFTPQEPLLGRFYIQLSSKDTDFEPGDFYFDIEIIKPDTGMVYRLCTLEFQLEGGPTNRTINPGVGQLPVGDEITIITLEQGNPIVIIASPVAMSAELFSRVDALEQLVESQELQINDLTSQLAMTVQTLDNYVQITDLHVQDITQLKVDLHQTQEDLIALTQRVDKL